MSSFARAERRRQERAAAKRPTLRRVWGRGEGDCLRACVASALGLPYEQTPDVDGGREEGFWPAWDRWAQDRGLAFHHFFSHAPAHLTGFWIAGVDGWNGSKHAVVMSGPNFAHDPAARSLRRDAVGPVDVRDALIVGTPDWVQRVADETWRLVAEGSPAVWTIESPADSDGGVQVLRSRGRHADAAAMETRIEGMSSHA